MKRIVDLVVVVLAFHVLIVPMAIIALAVRLTSQGPILYWSDRLGRDNRIFRMPKFRTMRLDTPTVATHLLVDPAHWLTPIGAIMRKSSLDELPQLWSILIGDMTLVGPRPALFNQSDLIAMRTELCVHILTPGLTGWAQVNGRDELPIPQKVQFDAQYMSRQSFSFDMYILWLTFLKVIRGDGVTH
jgi:O-antigen biosynthesis protein WbqP